jgi:uncharacterized RDD family membrane protein YckC
MSATDDPGTGLPPTGGWAPSGPAVWSQPGEYPAPGPGQPYSAGLFPDPASGLMLPQGTQLASVGRRIGAYFLTILLFIVTLGIGYLIWGLIVWGRGQTPSLQVLGMRCYRPETGQVAGWGWMALREVIGWTVDGIAGIITYLVSFILFASRQDHRSLHDLIAGTVVLYDPNKVLANR